MRAPWTARRSNQSILVEISPEYSLEGLKNQTHTRARARAHTEAPELWPPDVESWLIEKDSDTGKDGGQEEKRASEDEMVGWHH